MTDDALSSLASFQAQRVREEGKEDLSILAYVLQEIISNKIEGQREVISDHRLTAHFLVLVASEC